MIDPIQVFFSNQTEVLYEYLKMQLLNSFSLKPFSKRMVIVPSGAMQNWLILRLANDLGVATGIEFIPVHRAFHRILEVCHLSPPYFPNSIELSFAIELELKEIKKNFSHLSYSEKEAWQPIARYLMDKSESRLVHFSQHLGESLYLYGRAYDTIPSKGWQNRLIPLIYSKNPSWKLLSTAYLDPIVVKSDVELHFFGINDLNRAEYDYLLRLGSHIPVYSYVFSPSMMFWADIRSDRERSALLSFWQKHKVASNKLMTLNQLLELSIWRRIFLIFKPTIAFL
jgi:exonuclease V gamma subunit